MAAAASHTIYGRLANTRHVIFRAVKLSTYHGVEGKFVSSFDFPSSMMFFLRILIGASYWSEWSAIGAIFNLVTHVGETGDGRYKIYISHHLFLIKKRLHSILDLLLAHYVYLKLRHTKHENINWLINYNLINKGKFLNHPVHSELLQHTGWVDTICEWLFFSFHFAQRST